VGDVGLADALERALVEMPVENKDDQGVKLTIHSSQYSDMGRILAEHAKVLSLWKPPRSTVMELIALPCGKFYGWIGVG